MKTDRIHHQNGEAEREENSKSREAFHLAGESNIYLFQARNTILVEVVSLRTPLGTLNKMW